MADLVTTADGQVPAAEHAADLALRLRRRRQRDVMATFAGLGEAEAVELLDSDEFHAAPEVLAGLPQARAVALLEAVSADRAAYALRWMRPADRARLEAALDAETRAAVERILSFPADSAGSLMTTEVVAVPASWTAGRTLEHLRAVERSRETVYAIYVLDDATQQLVAAVPLRRLLVADPAASILAAASGRPPIVVPPTADREDVARLISRYDLLAIAVVDAAGRLLGIVTVDDVMTALMEEQSEDLQKLGGMAAIEDSYWESSILALVRKRAGWLAFLFISGMLTATAMQYFEGEIEKAVVLAVFVPLVMSSGGNSGSQATSLMIRSLALEEVRLADWLRVLGRELPAGLLLGAILCVLGVLRIFAWQLLGLQDYGAHWLLLGLTIGIALLGIVTVGSVVGSMLPFLLKRCGFDPAIASAPLIATLVDVTGIVIYFSVAYAILAGTLL
ncbi:MAG: magnesium transporter [Geminicoccaceae bacterium]